MRLLKLAEMYERAFERFVLDISQRYVKDASIREKLAPILEGRDDHEGRIGRELVRLNALLGSAADAASVERAALLDILEVERAARAFYLRALEEVRDGQVIELFRVLAREEAVHAALVEQALALADRKRSAKAGADAPRRSGGG